MQMTRSMVRANSAVMIAGPRAQRHVEPHPLAPAYRASRSAPAAELHRDIRHHQAEAAFAVRGVEILGGERSRAPDRAPAPAAPSAIAARGVNSMRAPTRTSRGSCSTSRSRRSAWLARRLRQPDPHCRRGRHCLPAAAASSATSRLRVRRSQIHVTNIYHMKHRLEE